MAEVLEYNPYAYEAHEDPYPIYKRLRDEAPCYRNEALGFWALSRHADVLAAFRNPERYSNKEGVSLDRGASHANAELVSSFLAMDPPRHTRMRALVSRGFTPRRVADLEPRIRAIASEHIDRFISDGRCDFIKAFAGKLPMDVISETLGVPPADRDRLRGWADEVVHREAGDTDVPPRAMAAAAQILRYFHAMVDERQARAGDDLTGALVRAEIDGDRLTKQEIVGFLFLMIIAGNETTTKMLGNALYWLWRNPGERKKVREDARLIPRWVEETLRYDNSTQALARTVLEGHELYGQTLRAGDRLVLLVGSANRDERAWEEPERFDVSRVTNPSLSFGQGTHFCLGAALARLEGRVALEEVQQRFPDFEIDPAGLVRVHSVNVRGYASMPIAFPS